MTDGIAEFLSARLAEVAAVALAAMEGTDGCWRVDIDGIVSTPAPPRPHDKYYASYYRIVYGEGLDETPPFAHIALHDPARVLREVAAARAALERHIRHSATGMEDWCGWCSGEEEAARWPCPDILGWSAIYSDHPEYREEWKP